MARVELKLAALGGDYAETATVIEWMVAAGAEITAGQPLVVVETAKAANEIAAPCDGVMAEIVAGVDEEITVGAVLARIETCDTAMQAVVEGGDADAGAPAAAPAVAAVTPSGAATSGPSRAPGERVFASPLARRLAAERGLAIADIAGSGPNGRVQKRDLEAHKTRAPVARPAAGGGYRRAMATHMARAAEVPQFSVSVDVDGSALLAVREALKRAGRAATLADLIVHVVAGVLKRNPELNAHVRDGRATLVEEINVGMALATPRGLVVPAVRNADRLDLDTLAAETARLAESARAGRLDAETIRSVSFTVSNLMPFGVSEFRALVNPPQAAILAVPAFRPELALRDGAVVERQVARLTVSADHRALDGAQVARFARRLKNALEGVTLA